MPEDIWAENTAEEVLTEVGTAPDTEEVESTSDVAQEEPPVVEAANIDPKKARTKEYSERLNADRAEIARKAQDDFVASSNFFDENGHKMTTKSDYDAWKDRQAEAALQQEFSSSYEDNPADAVAKLLDQKLASHPAIVAARRQEGINFINSEIASINAAFPDSGIKNIAEFQAHPKFREMDEHVRHGVSMLNAYKLANMDDILSRKTAAAKQAAFVSEASRSHLKAGASAGGDPIHMPADEMATWKALLPEKSEKQIRELYAKSKGS